MQQYLFQYRRQRESKSNLYHSVQLEREQVKSFIMQQEQNHAEHVKLIEESLNHQTNTIHNRIAQRRSSMQIDEQSKKIEKIVKYFNQRIQKIRDQVQTQDQITMIEQLEQEKLNKILQIQQS